MLTAINCRGRNACRKAVRIWDTRRLAAKARTPFRRTSRDPTAHVILVRRLRDTALPTAIALATRNASTTSALAKPVRKSTAATKHRVQTATRPLPRASAVPTARVILVRRLRDTALPTAIALATRNASTTAV